MTDKRTNMFWLQIQSAAICTLLLIALYAVAGPYFGRAARDLVIRSMSLTVVYMPFIALVAFIVSEFMVRRMGGAFNGLVPVSLGWTDWAYSGGAALWVITVLASETDPSLLTGVVMLVSRVGLSVGEAISSWRHRQDDLRV